MISNKLGEPYLKDIVLRMSGMFYAKLIGFLASIYTARLLGPADFGNIKIAMSMLLILGLLSGTFMRNALVTKVSQFEPMSTDGIKEFNAIFLFVLLLSIITIFLSFVLFYFIGPLSSREAEIILLLSLPVIILSSIIELYSAYFQGIGKLKLMTWLEVFRSTLNTSFVILFVWLFATSGWIAGRIGGLTLGLFIILFTFRKILRDKITEIRLSPSWRSFGNKNLWWYYKWSILGSGIALIVRNVDSIIVAEFFHDTEQVGFLGIGMLIYSGLSMYSQSISSANFNKVAKLAGKKDELGSLLIRLKLIVMPIYILIALLLYSFSESIVIILFGSSYWAAIPLVRILIIASVFLNYTQLNGGFWNATGNVKLFSKYYTYISLIYLISVIPFLQVYGLIGSAYAILLSTFIGMIFSDFLTSRNIHLVPKEISLTESFDYQKNISSI